MGDAKSATDQPRASKNRFDLVGSRVGRNVEILGFKTEEKIPNTAANKKSMETGGLKPADYFNAISVDAVRTNTMFCRTEASGGGVVCAQSSGAVPAAIVAGPGALRVRVFFRGMFRR